jgi:hypothetical protein
MHFFKFNGKFPEFTGKVIELGEEIEGLNIPHQIVLNGKPDPIRIATDTRIVSWPRQRSEKGKLVTFTPGTQNKKYVRMIIEKPDYIHGRVIAVGSFGFGQKIFFTNLLIDVGSKRTNIIDAESRSINIGFRPFPSEKRTAGQDLLRKEVILENDILYTIEKGEKVPWKYRAK